MSRNERIQKLARAIKDYRGAFNATTGKWLRAPQPTLRARIEQHLKTLGMNVSAQMERIDGFKKRSEFLDWIKEVSA